MKVGDVVRVKFRGESPDDVGIFIKYQEYRGKNLRAIVFWDGEKHSIPVEQLAPIN